jgi:hypothetical protein
MRMAGLRWDDVPEAEACLSQVQSKLVTPPAADGSPPFALLLAHDSAARVAEALAAQQGATFLCLGHQALASAFQVGCEPPDPPFPAKFTCLALSCTALCEHVYIIY